MIQVVESSRDVSQLLCVSPSRLTTAVWRGRYSEGGSYWCTPCSAGRYGATSGINSSACSGLCGAGRYGHLNETSISCSSPCPEGYVCPNGTTFTNSTAVRVARTRGVPMSCIPVYTRHSCPPNLAVSSMRNRLQCPARRALSAIGCAVLPASSVPAAGSYDAPQKCSLVLKSQDCLTSRAVCLTAGLAAW
jgi:hypothetical protein